MLDKGRYACIKITYSNGDESPYLYLDIDEFFGRKSEICWGYKEMLLEDGVCEIHANINGPSCPSIHFLLYMANVREISLQQVTVDKDGYIGIDE